MLGDEFAQSGAESRAALGVGDATVLDPQAQEPAAVGLEVQAEQVVETVPVDVAAGPDGDRRSRFDFTAEPVNAALGDQVDRKSTRLNSSHANISYAVFCLKKNK